MPTPTTTHLYDRENDAPLTVAHDGDAGYDLPYRGPETELYPGEIKVMETGVFVKAEPGDNFVGLVCSRSGLASKGIIVANAPGIVDAGYTGEVKVILANIGSLGRTVRPGDRIAQFLFMEARPGISGSVRGDGGFGSTGA